MPQPDLKQKTLLFIREWGMLAKGDKALAAVSGGVDSVVMLRILSELRDSLDFSLGVAHFDHGLRGAESDRDREFVRALADEIGVDFHSGQARLLEEKGEGSIQIRARKSRFDFFYQVMDTENYGKLALGHNRGDQVETSLMAMLKGYGFNAVSGIRPVSGRHIHPMLSAARKEIAEYALKSGLKWVEDSSNLKKDYLRNKVRHDILPFLRKTFPNLDSAILRLASEADSINEMINMKVSEINDKVMEYSGNERAVLDIDKFLKYLKFLRKYTFLDIFRKLAPDYRPSIQMLEEMDNLCQGRTGKMMPAGPVEVLNDRGRLIFSTGYNEEVRMNVDIDESLYVNGMLIHLEPAPLERVEFNSNPGIEFVDSDAICGQLSLRNWQPGDRFQPLGMDGEIKVSDFLVNAKISVFDKRRVLVLCDMQKVIWLCGMRLDERAKIKSSTRRILKLIYSPAG